MPPERDVPKPNREFRAAIRGIIAARWTGVWDAIPAALTDRDPEAVHDIRVAARRLKAAMDSADGCFPDRWYRPLRRVARRLAGSLGDVRDRDVILAALAALRERASAGELPGVDHLITRVKRERRQARKEMTAFLTDLERQGTREQTRRRFPPRPDPGLEAAVTEYARRIIADRAAKLLSYADIIPDPDAIEGLHAARSAARRLRYTLELFPAAAGDEGEGAIDRMRVLQDELGLLHDHDVRIALIGQEFAALPTKPGRKAARFRPGLEFLLREEQTARAARHVAVVEFWRELEQSGLLGRLAAPAGAPAAPQSA